MAPFATVFDKVKAVQFGFAIGKIGQVPSFGRGRPALSVQAHPARRDAKDSVNGGTEGGCSREDFLLQGQPDRIGPVLPQYAPLAQDA